MCNVFFIIHILIYLLVFSLIDAASVKASEVWIFFRNLTVADTVAYTVADAVAYTVADTVVYTDAYTEGHTGAYTDGEKREKSTKRRPSVTILRALDPALCCCLSLSLSHTHTHTHTHTHLCL